MDTNQKKIGIIPSRYKSTRFPGKPLVEIEGKSMIQRVYEQTNKSTILTAVAVATDDIRIFNHVNDFGGNVIMTSEKHQSGTDRCLEAARKLNLNLTDTDVIVNIQGDEPFIDPIQIDLLLSSFADMTTEIATLIREIKNPNDLFDSNIPKVIINNFEEAIYFSRSTLPYMRGVEKDKWVNNYRYFSHIGIYAYKMNVLEKITSLLPSSLELAESLEQLRWIENGFKIKTKITDYESISIDSPEDLKKIKPI